jgi:hypothetical protein
MDKAENERQYDVVDQMLSMYSSLRDSYARGAFILNAAMLACSIFLCAFRFADDKVLATFGLTPDSARIAFGITSVIILIISVIELRVRWKEVAGKFGEAADRLGALKAKYRRLYAETRGGDPKKNARLSREYEKVTRSLPTVPDRRFNRLKAGHRFKKVLSQRITANPKAPEWFLRWQLQIEGICQAIRKGKGHVREGDDAT